MLTLIKSPENRSIASNAEIIGLLRYAKSKLLTAGIPMQLKAVAYVRLCCTAMGKLEKSLAVIGTEGLNEFVTDNSYSTRLRDLCHQNPEWWRQCWISDRGLLQSQDPEIDHLLQPLGSFADMFAND